MPRPPRPQLGRKTSSANRVYRRRQLERYQRREEQRRRSVQNRIQTLNSVKEVESVEGSQCVVLEPTIFVNVKQEVFTEDCAVSNERTSLKQEFVTDKTNSVPVSSIMDAAYVSEETDVFSVVKEELSVIENCDSEDTYEMLPSNNIRKTTYVTGQCSEKIV